MPGNAWRWSREKKGQSNIAGHEHASWKVAISFLGLISGSSRVAREVDPKQIAYYLAYAPAKSSLATLVSVASRRYTVEQCIEEAKGETGLDEYEVRFWHSWYRHITLSMMAHAWLASIRLQEQEKKVQAQMNLPG